MYGRNPKTGKAIRILKSDSSIWKNQKTLVWLKETIQKKILDRWETVCVGVNEVKSATNLGLRIDAVLLIENTNEEIQFLKQKHLHGSKMIFLSRRFVSIMGEAAFANLQLRNVVCLEEIRDVFPFVGNQWNGTKEDALHLLALILRVHRIVGLEESNMCQERVAYTKSIGNAIKCMPDTTEPPQLWFLTQYYKPKNLQREREVKKCLDENIENPLIDKIILLNEKTYSLPKSNKIQQIVHGKRLTYGATIKWFQENAPSNTLCVFANSDIFLDESWLQIWSTNLEDKFLSLLRYDVQADGSPSVLLGPRSDSQDTWVFLSDSLKTREFNWNDLDFPFGQAGCDNAINVEMVRKKFLVVNPSLSIKTHHLHISNVRTYDPSNIVDKPIYFYVDPTGIHDMEPITDLKKNIISTMDAMPFPRRILSVSEKNLDIFCTMLAKQETYVYDRLSANQTAAGKIQIYKFENCFHTADGLVYDTHHIHVGRTESSQKAWSESRISPLSPSFYTEKTLCAHLPADALKTPELYLLHYVSKILLLKKEVGSGDFWCPQKENFTEALQIFNWSSVSGNVPVLPIENQAQAWCKEVYQWAPRESVAVLKEQIDILRESLYAQPLPAPLDNGRYVIITDKFCDAFWVNSIEEELDDIKLDYIYIGRSSITNILGKLRTAKGIIFMGGPNTSEKWSLLWMLPVGAKVIEIQNEMEQSGDAIHMAGACSLEYNLVTIPRGKLEFLQKESIRLVLETLQPRIIDESLPVIYVPRRSLTGFYSHAGDSFRELLRLWAAKKYVRVEEHPTAVQIWLHGVGDTLLYDRPTLEWLQAAPPDEQTWKKALFGNPAPTGDNSSSWTFWARKPELLEDLVKQGAGTRGYNQRKHLLVFYGKIENKVQERRRLTHDWESACTDFIMPKGGEYELTHAQYLEKLADAKYGLCLAGFGKKCHRETECMALGTVPVVATDVDMKNYADPPIEGIHYIRVADPAEADKKTEELTEEEWRTMSEACKAWWLKNCSVEGSWLLTQRLNKV